MDIPTTLTAISTAIRIAKDLQEIDKGLAQADLKLKIAELTEALANAKLGIVDAQEELAEREVAIKELRRHAEVRAATMEVDGFKYDVKDGKPVGHAYCPRCDVVDGLMIRLVDTDKAGRPDTCPQCKRDYIVATYLG